MEIILEMLQSALFNFHSFLTVVLLVICTCTYIKMHFPAILEQRTGYFLLFKSFLCWFIFLWFSKSYSLIYYWFEARPSCCTLIVKFATVEDLFWLDSTCLNFESWDVIHWWVSCTTNLGMCNNGVLTLRRYKVEIRGS